MAQQHDRESPYISEQFRGYMDYFSDDQTNNEPVILGDGTSVLFPKDWTDEDADKWSKGMELQRPSNTANTYDNFH